MKMHVHLFLARDDHRRVVHADICGLQQTFCKIRNCRHGGSSEKIEGSDLHAGVDTLDVVHLRVRKHGNRLQHVLPMLRQTIAPNLSLAALNFLRLDRR